MVGVSKSKKQVNKSIFISLIAFLSRGDLFHLKDLRRAHLNKLPIYASFGNLGVSEVHYQLQFQHRQHRLKQR